MLWILFAIPTRLKPVAFVTPDCGQGLQQQQAAWETLILGICNFAGDLSHPQLPNYL